MIIMHQPIPVIRLSLSQLYVPSAIPLIPAGSRLHILSMMFRCSRYILAIIKDGGLSVPTAIQILPITSYLTAKDVIPMPTEVKIIQMPSVMNVTQGVQGDDKFLK